MRQTDTSSEGEVHLNYISFFSVMSAAPLVVFFSLFISLSSPLGSVYLGSQ